MLICFLDQEGIVYREFVPPAMKFNADFYCDVLRRLHENVRRKSRQKWQNQNLIIHQGNAQLVGPLKFRSFWPRTTWQWSPIHHTHTIWPPVNFSSSPSWSFWWRVEDSTPLKSFKGNRSAYLTQFQKGTSRDVSEHGRNAGTAVFVQKWSTLKVMEEFNIQGKQTSFYKYCPGSFRYLPVKVCFSVSPGWHYITHFTVIVNIVFRTKNFSRFFPKFAWPCIVDINNIDNQLDATITELYHKL